ncbi:Glycosyltransferase involved in cell wall bisynthesis [Maridesulfovibrio ferrireducens]|uniref:Glycosyltransferase involved in cell wall bisynthesis n=1 Tax=Maridesulfovibrio ferrireducens TaxID=246191 RepID=A0A1G9HVF5_9BACT|nr:glycosyltransferase family 4 protein [Maridesulfovibrio ferrireducens]SDL16543.1 Glycosyltransferase involved in cell wall bisynthesis [Maridesulfovibrio ferrireducens]
MRIAFFAPHKPIDHETPSGDLMIGKSLHDYLCAHGHEVVIASRMRLRNVTTTPCKWPLLYFEYNKALKRVKDFAPDLWLTYHSYYKSPDLLGPLITKKLGIPYLIYQGVFSTKHRRNVKTWLGFMANKNALLHADHVFANKEIDHKNLSRIILPEKLTRTRPGINPDDFKFCPKSRTEIRKSLKIRDTPVLMSTAMLRSGVKEQSLTDLINAFAIVLKTFPETKLLIAGDGEARERLTSLAKQKTGDQVIFLGKINRDELFKYYSAADIFAYPGIHEALGMVYLEAQSAGLPVVAYSTRGPKEAVAHGETGLLSPEGDLDCLAENILYLFQNNYIRQAMRELAPKRIKEVFDQNLNLQHVEKKISLSISRRNH